MFKSWTKCNSAVFETRGGNLSTIKVNFSEVYSSYYKRDPKYLLPAIDTIRSQIDRKKWSFTHDISEEETSITLIQLLD